MNAAADTPVVPAAVLEQARTRPDALAVRQKARGIWRRLNWQQVWTEAEVLAAGLLADTAAGTPPRRVAVISTDTADAYVAGIAIQAVGGAAVFLSPDASDDEIAAQLAETGVDYVLAQDQEQCDKAIDARGNFTLTRIVHFDPRGLAEYADTRLLPVAVVRERGHELLAEDREAVRRVLATVDPDTIASVVVTAGYAGAPRGVLLSHRHLADAARRLDSVAPIPAGANHFVSMPLSRPMSQYLVFGVAPRHALVVNFPEWPSTVPGDRREVAPEVVVMSAREWQLVFDDMESRIRSAAPSARRIYRWARPGTETGKQRPLVARLLFMAVRRGLRRQLGFTRVVVAISSGAPLSARAVSFFSTLDVVVHDVYGFAEAGPLAVVSPGGDGARLLEPAPQVDVHDGAVHVRGPNLFSGYSAGDTRHDAQEWVASDDTAELHDGRLRLSGRREDLTPESDLAPVSLETPLLASVYIRHAVVDTGAPDGKYTVLVAINQTAVVEWLEGTDVPDKSYAALAGHPAVRDLIAREVAANAAGWPAGPRIGEIVLLRRPPDVASGELTIDGRVRRGRVIAAHRGQPAPLRREPVKEGAP